MEARYGPGLVGMFHDDGRFNHSALANKHLFIRGEEQSVKIGGGLEIKSTDFKAYWLGFVKGMQYAGLSKSDVAAEFTERLELSACFSTTYALLEVVEQTAYDIQTMFDSLHEIKIVKVLLHDSMKLMGDITVNYQ